MMSEEYGEIRIPQDLIKKIEIRVEEAGFTSVNDYVCLLYTSPSPRDRS